jgi:hypothetical protein
MKLFQCALGLLVVVLVRQLSLDPLSGVLVLNDRAIIVCLLLLEVFVVALCLIIECLAVLEYLYLVFIELDLLVVLDRLEHHLLCIVFKGD